MSWWYYQWSYEWMQTPKSPIKARFFDPAPGHHLTSDGYVIPTVPTRLGLEWTMEYTNNPYSYISQKDSYFHPLALFRMT